MRLVTLLLAVSLLAVPAAVGQVAENPLCKLTSSGCTAYHVVREAAADACAQLLPWCPPLP